MSRMVGLKAVLGYFGITPQALHHGVQLAACVLLGYLLAVAIGLPERFWVVITVLIVMRADTESVMDAGWDRVRGTVVGAVSGLLGVCLHRWGANATWITMAIVSVLAFASAALPMLRSSAITALIVLGAGELAGYSAFHVALLRVVQIAIGVGVCVVLALLTSQYSASARLIAGGATLLGRLGLQLRMSGVRAAPTEAQMEASATAVRVALQGLATLADSADRKFPWSRAQRVPLHERHHRRVATLMGRIVQDVVVLNRVLAALRQSHAAQSAGAAAETASGAVSSVAGQLAGKGAASLQALGQLVRDCGTPGETGAALLAAPLRLLLEDLQQLCASVGGGAGGVTSDAAGTLAVPARQ